MQRGLGSDRAGPPAESVEYCEHEAKIRYIGRDRGMSQQVPVENCACAKEGSDKGRSRRSGVGGICRRRRHRGYLRQLPRRKAKARWDDWPKQGGRVSRGLLKGGRLGVGTDRSIDTAVVSLPQTMCHK